MAQAAMQECAENSPRPWSHGTFYWNELMTHASERARKFYADTLGWTYEPFPIADGGTYWIAKAGDQTVGGIFEITDSKFAGVPEGWMGYIAVDNVDARVERATRAGATLMRPLFDISKVGRIAILREPGGAGIGWMTPATD